MTQKSWPSGAPAFDGHRLGRGQPGDDPHRHVGELRPPRDLEHRGGHGEDAGVAAGDDGDPSTRAGQLQGVGGALGLDPVVARVPLPGAG